jgi:recombination protein RecR
VSVIEELTAELAKLPGIGRKTATRLTYHLLKQPTAAVAGWRGRSRPLSSARSCTVCGT